MWTQVHFQELRSYRRLVVSLAEELYRRERDDVPVRRGLVGTYLKALPEDGSLSSTTAQREPCAIPAAVNELPPG